MKHKLVAVGLVLALAFGTTGCGKSTTTTATAGAEATPVKVVKVNTGRVANAVSISGKVTAGLEAALVPKTPGKVTAVLVDVGQRVRKGQLLVQLDTADIQAQINSAQAGLAVQRSLEDQAAIRYKDAKDNLDRTRYLFSQGAVSQIQLDSAQNQFDTAAASFNPAGGNTQTSAAVNQALAQIQALKVQLANLTVTAPADGTISARNIEVGEMASSAAPVLNLVNTDKMIVEGNLSESEVNLVKVGEEVKVLIKAVKDQPFVGKVLSISPSADSRTKAFPIRIELENKNALIKSGMIAEVMLDTQSKDNVLLIPKEAVLDRSDKKVVYVVQDGKQAVETVVTVGLGDATKVEVVTGLTSGQDVVVSGQQLLVDKAPVTVQAN
ncbi:MAG TPA: efflux RND transporter periplasmic adaptor subunit [Bacillota bacterium]|nr:efflux RND transporter periplasmic adaptor subunit [Bacillota bacterium]